MRYLILFLVVIFGVQPASVRADDKLVRLHVPASLVETGLLKYILPRFTLKTQVRITLVPEAAQADLALGEQGRALFSGPDGKTVHLAVRNPTHPGVKRFADWLTGDIGRKTVLAYAPNGKPLFSPPAKDVAQVVTLEKTGDAALGLDVSRSKCARCHTVDPASRISNIGSTPSFYVLRSLPDWEGRFAAFYALNPHPAFTQIQDVTEPFDISRPPPIVPITLTLQDLEAVLAYVASLQAADLGAPLASQ